MEPFISSRVYLKPLLPGNGFKTDIDLVLRQAKNELLKRVRAKLMATAFSRRAKKALSKALKVEIKPSSLVITALHPAFAPLVLGQKKGKMRWLLKARRPIPIIKDDGTLIFRNATARSMRKKGRWLHPGRAPSDFVTSAKAESRAFLKQKFEKELKRQVRTAWKRR